MEEYKFQTMIAHKDNFGGTRPYSAIRYIVIHYTANDGDHDESNARYFQTAHKPASSAHYFVDENEIVQSVLDSNTAWHCGAKSYKHPKCRNDNSIGIEMCSEKDENGQYYINQATQNRAVNLIKVLIKQYNISIENVLRHYDVTGKICPEPFVKNQVQWLDFKAKLTQQSEGKKEMLYNYMDENMPVWAKPTIQKLIDKGALKGNEKGELMLTDVMLRIFVANDRMGCYDK